MVHGLRGDDEARESWLAIRACVNPVTDANCTSREMRAALFDTLVLLHRGQLDEADGRLTVDPDQCSLAWTGGAWRPWYAALWAETAALAGHRHADRTLRRAQKLAAPNLVARALVARADAWMRGDREALVAVAKELDAAGCRYQMARTLVLAGGEEQAEGERILADIGAEPMARI